MTQDFSGLKVSANLICFWRGFCYVSAHYLQAATKSSLKGKGQNHAKKETDHV
jgi:hypothetical protein